MFPDEVVVLQVVVDLQVETGVDVLGRVPHRLPPFQETHLAYHVDVRYAEFVHVFRLFPFCTVLLEVLLLPGTLSRQSL